MTDADLAILLRPLMPQVLAAAKAQLRTEVESQVRAEVEREQRAAHSRNFSAESEDSPAFRPAFTAEEVSQFADYFSDDGQGHYPFSIHRHFGLSWRQFADAAGVLRKQVASGDGKERWAWIKRPAKAEAKPGADVEAIATFSATFAAPGPPPRPGLAWKEDTHHWIRPETGERYAHPTGHAGLPSAEHVDASAKRPLGDRKPGSLEGGSATDIHRITYGGREYVLKSAEKAGPVGSKKAAERVKAEELSSHVALDAGVHVPATRTLDLGGKPHVVSEWVDGTPLGSLKDPKAALDALPAGEVPRMILFDYATGYSDNHLGNYLVGADGHLHGIDRETAFGVEGDSPEEMAFFLDENKLLRAAAGTSDKAVRAYPLPREEIARVVAAGQKMLPQLTGKSAEAAKQRIELLQKLATAPNPTVGDLIALSEGRATFSEEGQEPATFSAPGPAPHPGWEWHEETHRWRNPANWEETEAHPRSGPAELPPEKVSITGHDRERARLPDTVPGRPKTKKARAELGRDVQYAWNEARNALAAKYGTPKINDRMSEAERSAEFALFSALTVITSGNEAEGPHDLGPVSDLRYAGYYKHALQSLDRLRASAGAKTHTATFAHDADVETLATFGALHKDGEEWETSGRKYKREGGKTIRVGKGGEEVNHPEPGNASAEQKPARIAQLDPTQTVDTHASIDGILHPTRQAAELVAATRPGGAVVHIGRNWMALEPWTPQPPSVPAAPSVAVAAVASPNQNPVAATDIAPPQSREVKLGEAPLPRSQAAVHISTGVDEAAAARHLQEVFGEGDTHKALSASLGMPDDAEITVTRAGPYVKKYSDDKDMPGARGVRVEISHPSLGRVSRFVGVDNKGRRFIKNEILEILPEARGGLGSTIFAKQVEAASSAGMDYIATHAAGWNGSTMNGYYTWPRFGYNQRITKTSPPGANFKKLRERFPNAKSILDVMDTKAVQLPPDEFAATKAALEKLDVKLKKPPRERTAITGAEWWQIHGSDLHNMTFELDPKSRSMAALKTYLASSKAKKAANPDPKASGATTST